MTLFVESESILDDVPLFINLEKVIGFRPFKNENGEIIGTAVVCEDNVRCEIKADYESVKKWVRKRELLKYMLPNDVTTENFYNLLNHEE